MHKWLFIFTIGDRARNKLQNITLDGRQVYRINEDGEIHDNPFVNEWSKKQFLWP